MKRLFLNIGFTPAAAMFEKTAGICGIMDDDVTNDLTGPDGRLHNNTVNFVESCEYVTEIHDSSKVFLVKVFVLNGASLF